MTNTLNVLSHPLVNAELSKLRKTSTSAKEFREVCSGAYSKICLSSTSPNQGIRTVSTFLGYEASRDLEEKSFEGVGLRFTRFYPC